MTKLPMFSARSRGPLQPEEHEACLRQLGDTFEKMERLIVGTEQCLRGRLQRYRGSDCPCVYVFYNQQEFENDQRGIMYFFQDLEDGGFEVVFREWKGSPPINSQDWEELASPLHDDRYKVCSANKWKWRAFQVRSKEDFDRARSLVIEARTIFEEVFSDALGALVG